LYSSILWFVVAFHAVYSSCSVWVTHVDGKPVYLCVWLLKCRMYRRLYPKECAGVSWPAGYGRYSNLGYLEKVRVLYAVLWCWKLLL